METPHRECLTSKSVPPEYIYFSPEKLDKQSKNKLENYISKLLRKLLRYVYNNFVAKCIQILRVSTQVFLCHDLFKMMKH